MKWQFQSEKKKFCCRKKKKKIDHQISKPQQEIRPLSLPHQQPCDLVIARVAAKFSMWWWINRRTWNGLVQQLLIVFARLLKMQTKRRTHREKEGMRGWELKDWWWVLMGDGICITIVAETRAVQLVRVIK